MSKIEQVFNAVENLEQDAFSTELLAKTTMLDKKFISTAMSTLIKRGYPVKRLGEGLFMKTYQSQVEDAVATIAESGRAATVKQVSKITGLTNKQTSDALCHSDKTVRVGYGKYNILSNKDSIQSKPTRYTVPSPDTYSGKIYNILKSNKGTPVTIKRMSQLINHDERSIRKILSYLILQRKINNIRKIDTFTYIWDENPSSREEVETTVGKEQMSLITDKMFFESVEQISDNQFLIQDENGNIYLANRVRVVEETVRNIMFDDGTSITV